MNGVIIAAIICGTVIILSLIDKIGKNKCKRCISKNAMNEVLKSNKETLNNLAIDIEALFR